MNATDPVEIGKKIDSLGLWKSVMPYNWAVKPRGTVFPYFCTSLGDQNPAVKARFLMLEGWQTIHDFVRTRVDRNFGFYSTPMELPHFELLVLASGEAKVFRHDPGYVPRDLTESESALVVRVLWECYGIMMRIESEPTLPMTYSEDRCMFARVETAPGVWEDAPLKIPDPQPHVEKVSFKNEDVAKAKDLPFATEESLEVDFRLVPNLVTREPHPRCAYILCAIDGATGEKQVWDSLSVRPDGGLRAMWESVPPRLLKHLVARGRIPGEIKLVSGRMFRLLRPLCIELPFKLSLHDSLPAIEKAYAE